jgi:hypothetical protein
MESLQTLIAATFVRVIEVTPHVAMAKTIASRAEPSDLGLTIKTRTAE